MFPVSGDASAGTRLELYPSLAGECTMNIIRWAAVAAALLATAQASRGEEAVVTYKSLVPDVALDLANGATRVRGEHPTRGGERPRERRGGQRVRECLQPRQAGSDRRS